MSSQVANFASGIGVYDSTLYNNPVLDTSANVGSGDLSLNATQQQYMMSNTNFTTLAGTGNGISFSGWFYPVGNQSVGSTIFDISGIGASVSLFYGTTGTNTGTLTGAFNGIDVSSSINVNAGQWHFFTYTVYCTSLSTAYQSLYIDNSMNSSTSYPSTQNTASYVAFSAGASTPNTGSYIGYGKGTASPAYSYFNGKIDDFRFYNRVLSPPEVNVLYNFNYKSGAIPAITSQMNYDISYVNAVQIDVSGIFSGLYVTRTAQVGSVTSVTSSTVSCANLVFVNATTWAYVDTTVAADTSYSYTVQPYVMNTSGNLVNFGSVTTTPIYNGFFNQGVALPVSGTYINANTANVPGWSFSAGTNINLCNGSVPTVFTGVLPSTVTYYIDISQNVAQSTSLSQYVGIYQGTSGYVSFYAWPKDVSYNGTESISVSLGGITLLNQYTFTPFVLSATPYTAFNLPFSMVAAGTYLLTITVTNPSTYLSGINFGGVQIRSLSTPAIGYKNIDPSGLALYYPFDSNTVSGTVVYDCSAGFTGLIGSADASLCGGAQLDTLKYITGNADVSLNGSTCYVQMGNWTCPGANIGNGFTICGWFNPSTIEPSNATLCLFQNTGTNSLISVFLNQQNRWLDFSYNLTSGTGAVGTQTEYIANTVSLTTNGWNYFAMTGSCSTVGVMNLTYFLNDVSLASLTGGWPTSGTALTFTSNTMGGTPLNVPMNSAGKLGFFQGYMDDFRVYNRALSQNDIFALWSYGFSKNSYANLIDPLSLGMYYPMEQGSTLTKSAPSPFTGFTPSAISASGFTLIWTGGAGVVNSYVYGVTPSGGSRSVVFPTGTPPTVVFSGLTAPSSAPYNWAVDISLTNTAGTTIGNTTVYAPPTALVLSGAYSAGNVTLTWTGGLGNAVTVSYTITSGSATTTSGTGITSPYSAPVTAGGGPWTFSVTATNTIGSVNTTTTVAQNPFVIASITSTNGSYLTDQKSSLSSSLSTGNGIVGRTSVTNGVTYQCYAFGQTSTWGTYTLTYTGGNSYIYVLAVGGGGGGGSQCGGGGGAGGVVMNPVYLSTGTNTITVSVGVGGTGAGPNLNNAVDGTSTTVTFNANTSVNITAGGGGHGGNTGSGGGVSNGGGGYASGGQPNTNNNNYGNIAGIGNTNIYTGGGGGAGTAGQNGFSGIKSGDGGNGIQCYLPGINTFSPSGILYGTYYWGGGGGGGSYQISGGNGGNGGGGGGTLYGGGVAGYGGYGLNNGVNGVNNNTSSGAGGANTGGGGGGSYTSIAGNGGSGIVVIAFPQSTITSNISAVLPSTLVTSNQYNAVLNNTSLTTSAYNSIKGAFACKLLNYNYFGPIMTLRYSNDTQGWYTANFYADVCGNVGTGYLGTGQSVSDWLSVNGANTTYAYVTKWYNQGMDVSFNSATQYTIGSQPIYDVANGLINFGYTGTNGGTIAAPQTNAFFNLPNGALPYADASYSYILRSYNISTSSTYVDFFAGGANSATNAGCYLQLQTTSPYTYMTNWAGTGLVTYNSALANLSSATMVATTYTSGSGALQLYVNDVLSSYSTSVGTRVQVSTGNVIGGGGLIGGQTTYYYNGQMYNMFVFQSSIVSADRLLIEQTPYTYTTYTTIVGLTTTSVTATGFTLSWTSFSATATYALWINGTFVMTIVAGTGTLTTGTVTPTMNGPWNLNLYAYGPSPDYALLARGSLITPIFLLDFTSATAPTADSIGTYPVTVVGTVGITNDAQAGYVMTGGTQFYNVPGLITSGPHTISLWFKSTSVNGNYDPFSSALGATYFNIANSNGNNMYWKFVTTNATLQTSSIMNANTWYFLTVTFTGLTITLYINGTSSASASQTTLNYNYLTSAVNIGAYSTNNTTGDYGTGCYIYGYRQYNCALSSAQIVQLMAMTKRSGIP